MPRMINSLILAALAAAAAAAANTTLPDVGYHFELDMWDTYFNGCRGPNSQCNPAAVRRILCGRNGNDFFGPDFCDNFDNCEKWRSHPQDGFAKEKRCLETTAEHLVTAKIEKLDEALKAEVDALSAQHCEFVRQDAAVWQQCRQVVDLFLRHPGRLVDGHRRVIDPKTCLIRFRDALAEALHISPDQCPDRKPSLEDVQNFYQDHAELCLMS